MRFVYKPAVEDEITRGPLRAELKKRAGQIAAETRTQARMAGTKRYDPIEVDATEKGARAAAQGPFAHLDEWGSINNAPTAAMRRAAAKAGRFKEQ